MLSRSKILFLDCQTTGMRPSVGRVLEIAWALCSPDHAFGCEAHLVRLPEGEQIPRKVTEITGIRDHDLTDALSEEDVFARLREALTRFDQDPVVVAIHYAQFEKPFLADWFSRFDRQTELPFSIVCTHQLTKRLFPNLPSQNLRATAGFFGPPVLGPNRAATFVNATGQIWSGLSAELERQGLLDWEAVHAWLTQKKSKSQREDKRFEYRLDKVKRLELPDQPGVYRMLAKNGEVLYVGKATSLKSRVNSYFRGVKNRDGRKLEMLAQVWDLRVTACRSPLEAALLETDEIKRFNPPYNVVMKTGRRHLVFYSRDFTKVSTQQSDECPIGPFRNHNWIEQLRALARSLEAGRFEAIFYNPIEERLMVEGFAIFLSRLGLRGAPLKRVRTQLALGLGFFRRYEEPADDIESESAEEAPDAPLTSEDVAGKFERLLRRAGAEYWRMRKLTRLLNARVQYQFKGQACELEFRAGRPTTWSISTSDSSPANTPWSGLDIETYDRMSVLLSELNKYEHRIDPPSDDGTQFHDKG